jgi:hypothetical protein
MYKNISGKSGVRSYSLSSDSITVTFQSGLSYQYTIDTIGAGLLNEMKKLATAGEGLNRFINSNKVVKNGYVKKW